MYYLICCLLFVFLISVTVFFSSGSFFKFHVRIFTVFFFFFYLFVCFCSNSVIIIITNSSESLPSTLYTSVFWLFCQRLSHSLSMKTSPTVFPFFSIPFSCSAMSSTLQPRDCSMSGLPIHHQLPEFTQTHVHWVSDDIQPSYSVVPFSSCIQSFPASGCFQMNQFFASGGQSIKVH